jgi:predicted dehydrogenase
MKQYRVALIGTGSFADVHVAALRAAGERVQLLAAVNQDAERGKVFCLKHNIPAFYTQTAKMLSDVKPALVHICTPPATHADLSIQCLEAGAHVLCEKPLCGSLAEFDRLTDAEERSEGYLSTVFQWRFGSAAQQMKRMIEKGKFGRPLVAVCQTLWYRDREYYSVPWRGKWATSLGGTTMGHGIHLMDLLLWLMDDWQEVQAIMATLDHAIEVEDFSAALVKFASGAMATITNSAVSPRQETYLRMDFQRSTVEVTALYSYNNENWRFTPDDVEIPENHPGGLHSQITHLLDSLDDNERPLVSGIEARRILEFNTALYKSALTGHPVARDSITPDDPFYYSMRGQV